MAARKNISFLKELTSAGGLNRLEKKAAKIRKANESLFEKLAKY